MRPQHLEDLTQNPEGPGKTPFTGDTGLGGEIRTPDPLVPNQMRYQTALHRVITIYLLQFK